jgi:hypothetical protein
MTLITDAYLAQRDRWPASGRTILAQYDERTIVVYQAYRPEIGLAAARTGRFGDGWKRDRMTWIKPNFLWMMYRCGWATKQDQEVVLALRLRRDGFESLLSAAVPSSFDPMRYSSEEAWRVAVKSSEVRLQWDPDHDPYGAPLERRAIQLGLRGKALAAFANEWIVGIEDVSDFVKKQHAVVERHALQELVVPREDAYPMPGK